MNLRFALQENRSLSELSTFGIGGPARYFCEVSSITAMQELLADCFSQKIPYLVIGKGSNTLFDDRGFEGLVILNKISFCIYTDLEIYVGAGYSFALLGVQAARKGLTGLEFASGIPASVGGAVYMNAGANGMETSQVIKEVSYISEKGELEELPKEKIAFSYRSSSFQNKKGALVAARFLLEPSSDARQKQLKIIDYRTKTQPYGEKSAGCIFRNPSKELAAGALIEQCGLKGVSVGGAQVSHLHANFIVNKGGAKAQDVLSLIALISERVYAKTGITLETEVRYISYVSS
jgi:UDP-N-acetylmuramate dehydrogenase